MTSTSIAVVFGMVQDGTLNTREQAKAFVEAEAERRAECAEISVERAREILLSNIGYCTGYCDHALADRIMDLFQTEHPVFGKTHPTPEEAFRIGLERGRQHRQEKLIDNQEDTNLNDH